MSVQSISKTNSAPGELSNILNDYRSVTYNITLATISRDGLKDPDLYRKSGLKYIIASSKGKQSRGISTDVTAQANSTNTSDAKQAVESFNKSSGGALDLYIDGLEIDSIITPNPKTGVSQSTTIKFEIYEPFSANGFIEALYTSALAAGWPNYLVACYLLKIEFYGYPDNINSPIAEPVLIDATRYIPIRITGSEMDVSEQGTKYRVSAIAYNEIAFSTPNRINSDISMEGVDVYEVLKNFFSNLNKSIQEATSKEVSGRITIFNEYEIYFPKTPDPDRSINLDLAEKNEIGKARMPDLLKENAIFKFVEPASKEEQFDEDGNPITGDSRVLTQYSKGKESRLLPRKHGIQFSKGSNIHQVIEAVIVDSLYVKGILENIELAKKNNDGMIDYFQVMIHTEPKGVDPITNEEKFKFKYIVCPYKIHYSMLPDQQNTRYRADSVKSYIKRTYNYIYTGKNIDVLGFKLNFNNLYFQAAMPKQGNSDRAGTANAASAAGSDVIKRQPGQAADAQKSSIPVPQTISDPDAGSVRGRASPIRSDPYYQIAYQVNQALLESVNMLTGDIDILGDPFYLSTAGMGNYLPKSKDNAITVTGESNFNLGPVVVRVNFRNPIDIDETTGLTKFSELTPFSGIYRVNQCRHILRDGVFKQSLKLMRYNGQILENDNRKTTLAIETIKQPKELDQFVNDSAVADVKRQGIKPNELQLSNLINRGLPTNGLPGSLSNIIGSVNSAAQSALKTVSGVVGQGSNIVNQTSQLGIPVGSALNGVNALNQGIRLGSDALSTLNNAAQGTSALITQAAATAKTIIPGSADNLLIDGTINDLTNQVVAQGQAFSQLGENLSQTGIALANSAKDIVNNTIDAVQSIGQNAAELVSDVGNKISNITSAFSNGTIGDIELKNLAGLTPAAFASKLGIDPAQLSGLTGQLDSKILQQLDNVIGSIPSNVSLNSIKEQGIVMANLTAEKIKNLPAVFQEVSAPLTSLGESLTTSLTPEQRSAVIADATAKGIPIDSALRSASAFGIDFSGMSESAQKLLLSDNPQALAGGLAQLGKSGLAAVDAVAGKISSIKSQIDQIYPLGALASVESTIAGVQQSLGNLGSGVTQLSNLGKSVTSQFGSLAAAEVTPLSRVMNSPVNNENDPNVPVFGGRVIRYNISEIQQKAKIEAFNKALSEGKSEREADSIANAAGNLAGAQALSKIT